MGVTMRKRMKTTRPSHATVVAYVALFVALGAGAMAASHLGKNTVGTKQLRKNAVTTAKIKNEAVTGAKVKKGTLTGTQINLASLGTVPSAANAQALEGQSASQLLSASKLHCPSGMVPYEGVCYQEAPKSAVGWVTASLFCWHERLRLPTLGELIGFEINNFKVQPVEEWTEPDWLNGSTTQAWIGSASEEGS